jgi:hypothetical protein
LAPSEDSATDRRRVNIGTETAFHNLSLENESVRGELGSSGVTQCKDTTARYMSIDQ